MKAWWNRRSLLMRIGLALIAVGLGLAVVGAVFFGSTEKDAARACRDEVRNRGIAHPSEDPKVIHLDGDRWSVVGAGYACQLEQDGGDFTVLSVQVR